MKREEIAFLWEPVRRLYAEFDFAILECNTQRFFFLTKG